mgnify:FL=1|jgi:protease YdgD
MQHFLKRACLVIGLLQGVMGLTAASATDMDRQWPAVGRLNVTGGGFCTATLIGELHVLTAAHCVFDAQSGARVDVDDLEFRAGWQDGQAESYRKIAAVKVHPDFSFAEQEGLKRVASDLAILRLRTPITHPNIIPFSVAQMPMRGARVAVVSYAHDRSEGPKVHQGCTILGRKEKAQVFGCEVDYGSSGAPVFRLDLGMPMIISVISAKSTHAGEPISLGAAAGEKLVILPSRGANFLRP